MARVPVTENFRVLPDAGISTRFDGNVKPADITQNAKHIIKGLEGFAAGMQKREEAEVNDAANKYREHLANQSRRYGELSNKAALFDDEDNDVLMRFNSDNEDYRNELTDGWSSSKRRMFERQIQSSQIAYDDRTQSHRHQQSIAWYTDSLAYRTSNNRRDASDYMRMQNPDKAAEKILENIDAYRDYLVEVGGKDREVVDEAVSKFASDHVREVLDEARLIDKDLPDKLMPHIGRFLTASEYAEETKKGITSDFSDLADKYFKGDMQNNGGYIGVGSGTQSDRASSLNKLVDVIKFNESAGQGDYDKKGNPLTSPRGAMYAMQVMPDTAKNPGYGIKPAKDNSPEEYNRVGRELLGVFNKKYDGDVAKICAAYNWGVGNTDAAIKKYGRNWMKQLPKETRNYIDKTVKQVGAYVGDIDRPGNTASYDRISQSYTQQHLGTPYKSGQDCSWWVRKGFQNLVSSGVIDSKYSNLFQGNSENIITQVANATGGFLPESELRARGRSGLVIGIATGSTKQGYEKGRKYGVNHIVTTFTGDNGQIMVSSNDSSTGVRVVPYSKWINESKIKNGKLYAADASSLMKRGTIAKNNGQYQSMSGHENWTYNDFMKWGETMHPNEWKSPAFRARWEVLARNEASDNDRRRQNEDRAFANKIAWENIHISRENLELSKQAHAETQRQREAADAIASMSPDQRAEYQKTASFNDEELFAYSAFLGADLGVLREQTETFLRSVTGGGKGFAGRWVLNQYYLAKGDKRFKQGDSVLSNDDAIYLQRLAGVSPNSPWSDEKKRLMGGAIKFAIEARRGKSGKEKFPTMRDAFDDYFKNNG